MAGDLTFDWDDGNINHIALHDIQAAEVMQVLANEAIDLGYEFVNSEERWTSVGHTSRMRILVVVWTMRGESVRPVTAYEAGKQLTADYLRAERMVRHGEHE
jgi:uncharacterized protein